jgi:hypothetical protein
MIRVFLLPLSLTAKSKIVGATETLINFTKLHGVIPEHSILKGTADHARIATVVRLQRPVRGLCLGWGEKCFDKSQTQGNSKASSEEIITL